MPPSQKLDVERFYKIAPELRESMDFMTLTKANPYYYVFVMEVLEHQTLSDADPQPTRRAVFYGPLERGDGAVFFHNWGLNHLIESAQSIVWKKVQIPPSPVVLRVRSHFLGFYAGQYHGHIWEEGERQDFSLESVFKRRCMLAKMAFKSAEDNAAWQSRYYRAHMARKGVRRPPGRHRRW